MRLKNLFFVLLSSSVFSQTSFNYQLNWATYFGPINTNITGIYEHSSSSVFVDALTNSVNPSIGTPPDSYYNQFVTSGSQPFTGTYNIPNNFTGKFSSEGNFISAGYSPYTAPNSPAKFPYFRDRNGNIYEFQSTSVYPTLSQGAWLSSAPDSTNMILTKYDINNTMLWQTYIPGNNSFNILEVDHEGNIYFAGSTKWQHLADPGTFQPDFNLVYDVAGISMDNTYIVKLNPQGQKMWATYTPSGLIGGLAVFEDKLYIYGNRDLDPTGADLSTPGTFQLAKAVQFIAEIDANTGQRTWGTYYGTPGNTGGSGISDIKADESGVYISGMTFGISGTYFATEGAYRTECTDGFDMFVTKFSHSGGRLWSTYLGTDGYESFSGDRGLDVKNGKLLLTGLSTGSQNISTPGAYITTKPNANNQDIFFSMIDTGTGFPDFISYYGGTSNSFTATSVQCIFSKDSDGFFLYGDTGRTTGYSSSNGYQQNIIYPSGVTTGVSGFMVKFGSKSLSASDVDIAGDLVLYDNPNNGNFSLRGNVLNKDSHIIKITDRSGRLIYSKNIQKNQEQYFNLENELSAGNYLLSVIKNDQTLVKAFKLIVKDK